jgi:hypothetical protein
MIGGEAQSARPVTPHSQIKLMWVPHSNVALFATLGWGF